MDIWTLIGGGAIVVGLIAGIVQIVDYVQKQHEKKVPTNLQFMRRRMVPSPFGGKCERQTLSTYIRQERADILSALPPGSIALLVEDIVGGEDLFIPPLWKSYLGEAGSKELVKHLIDILSQGKRVLLLGDPGQGKTTISKRIFTILADDFLSGSKSLLPVYIPLREVAYLPVKTDGTISWLWNYLRNKPQRPIPISLEQFTSLASEKRLVFLFDGFDEMGGELSQSSINERAACNMFYHCSILTCRKNFYELYLSVSAIQENYIDKIELMPLQFTDTVKKYIEAFCKKKESLISENIIKVIATSHSLLDLARRPLLLVMILDIFTDSPELLEKEWSLAKLYDAYTQKWLKHEAMKPTSVLRWHEKAALIEEIAWSIYIMKAPFSYLYTDSLYQNVIFTRTELSNILYSHASKYQSVSVNLLIDDICLRTFLIGDHGNYYYFIHKSFQEYYAAKHILSCMSNNADSAAQSIREFMQVEISTFLRGMLISNYLTLPQRDLITNYLIEAFRKHGGDDYHSVTIRDHASFYLAYLRTRRAVQFLEDAHKRERNKDVQRAIVVGLATFCDRLDILEQYIGTLYRDSEAAPINTGYHLVYYGDQLLEDGYCDKGGKKCDATIGALIHHLGNNRYRNRWVLDLFTLRYLLVSRGEVAFLTNTKDLLLLKDFFNKDFRNQSKAFQKEKQLLQTELQKIGLM